MMYFIKKHLVIMVLIVSAWTVWLAGIIDKVIPVYREYLKIIWPLYEPDLTFWIYWILLTFIMGIVTIAIQCMYYNSRLE